MEKEGVLVLLMYGESEEENKYISSYLLMVHHLQETDEEYKRYCEDSIYMS